MKARIGIFLILYMVFSTTHVLAEWPKKESDFTMLPPYCKARILSGNKSPEYNRWLQRLGRDTFVHVHHYCAGLFTMGVANRDYEKRGYLLNRALGEFAYMEQHAPKQSQLMPEIFMKKGKVMLLLGRDPEALSAFNTSLLLNKRYSPSYMAIADYYILRKQYEEAMDITKKGLIAVPKSKGLKRRQNKISSKIKAQGGVVNSGSTDQIQEER